MQLEGNQGLSPSVSISLIFVTITERQVASKQHRMYTYSRRTEKSTRISNSTKHTYKSTQGARGSSSSPNPNPTSAETDEVVPRLGPLVTSWILELLELACISRTSSFACTSMPLQPWTCARCLRQLAQTRRFQPLRFARPQSTSEHCDVGILSYFTTNTTFRCPSAR